MALDRAPHERSLAVVRPAESEPLRRLDPYRGGLAEDTPRIEALATISCGFRQEGTKDRPGLPRASRAADERQIHLHDPMGRAPELTKRLAENGWRFLDIAFPLDDPNAFILQRFSRYSASRLEIYGDDAALTVIDARDEKQGPLHKVVEAGTDDYDRLVRTCKADTRIFFTLAEWGPAGPEVVFPDGLGFYAIRTTSRHSVRSIQQQLLLAARFTHGRLAGLPFRLEIDYREVAGPDGSKRTIPVWTITTKPPEGIRLSSRNFSTFARDALEQGAALTLPAPEPLSLAEAEHAGPPPVDDPSPEELALLDAGGPAFVAHWTRAWHALAKGTRYEADEERHAWVLAWTHGETDSLSAYLHQASEAEATALVAAFGEAVRRARVLPSGGRRYEELFNERTLPEGNEDAYPSETRLVDVETGEVLDAEPAPPTVVDVTPLKVSSARPPKGSQLKTCSLCRAITDCREDAGLDAWICLDRAACEGRLPSPSTQEAF